MKMYEATKRDTDLTEVTSSSIGTHYLKASDPAEFIFVAKNTAASGQTAVYVYTLYKRVEKFTDSEGNGSTTTDNTYGIYKVITPEINDMVKCGSEVYVWTAGLPTWVK